MFRVETGEGALLEERGAKCQLSVFDVVCCSVVFVVFVVFAVFVHPAQRVGVYSSNLMLCVCVCDLACCCACCVTGDDGGAG